MTQFSLFAVCGNTADALWSDSDVFDGVQNCLFTNKDGARCSNTTLFPTGSEWNLLAYQCIGIDLGCVQEYGIKCTLDGTEEVGACLVIFMRLSDALRDLNCVDHALIIQIDELFASTVTRPVELTAHRPDHPSSASLDDGLVSDNNDDYENVTTGNA